MSPKAKGQIGSLHAPMRHSTTLSVGLPFALDAQHLRSLKYREINVREAFTIIDAAGNFFRASLKAVDHNTGEALAYEQMTSSTESPAQITLLCAVLSRQKMLVVVQKATELGCVRVVPVHSDHSVPLADLQKEKPWAWPGQALKASRQCRRASVPEVLQALPLETALAATYWTDATQRFYLDDATASGDSGSPFNNVPTATTDYALAVGPEGGWSARERTLFANARATTLRLGSRILRAETAVFAGLSVLQHRLGDLGPL